MSAASKPATTSSKASSRKPLTSFCASKVDDHTDELAREYGEQQANHRSRSKHPSGLAHDHGEDALRVAPRAMRTPMSRVGLLDFVTDQSVKANHSQRQRERAKMPKSQLSMRSKPAFRRQPRSCPWLFERNRGVEFKHKERTAEIACLDRRQSRTSKVYLRMCRRDRWNRSHPSANRARQWAVHRCLAAHCR